ncbi:tRNA modification GTPase [Rhizomicrobium palustre]|uniref:tRNA modification GTPase MnmE n=1 Tax=Rhizomicrobium palustre TaxID=189966 RepID=A0A846MXA7_9PROT|nr:tRNA uridine-5-carboxymethylaminomethyl(34) synthesis GTPase MnmE [Rhizomicrobium palustre]NIK88188.1 tRNA modification GTPase [Rhizomicrobium palustre]
MRRDDTIYALASGAGRAGVAVVRISGPDTRIALSSVTGQRPPAPRRAALRNIQALDGMVIDRGLVLWFPAPFSFTGEDVAELHCHGGRAIIEAVLAALSGIPGVRLAEPGEFSRRAVLNGKFDLTQAEAIADLVDAETPAQRSQALRQYDGTLSTLYDGWRSELSKALAWAEAAIDFSDEELPEEVVAEARRMAESILGEITEHLSDARGELVRDGLFVAIVGPPNAGKSSLINALAGRDVAIVSEKAGTTRDIIEVRLNLGGYAVVVADTAGLRAAADDIEAEGVRRALARAETADVVVLLRDGTDPDNVLDLPDNLDSKTVVTVWNKADREWPKPLEGLKLSLKSGAGLEDVVTALSEAVRARLESAEEAPVLTRARHREALTQAAAALERAGLAPELELYAEDLRLAVRAIGRITGRVDVEDLLDVIFRDFCIGK